MDASILFQLVSIGITALGSAVSAYIGVRTSINNLSNKFDGLDEKFDGLIDDFSKFKDITGKRIKAVEDELRLLLDLPERFSSVEHRITNVSKRVDDLEAIFRSGKAEVLKAVSEMTPTIPK